MTWDFCEEVLSEICSASWKTIINTISAVIESNHQRVLAIDLIDAAKKLIIRFVHV